MIQRLLVRLLHYANTDPPGCRQQFYALKERLLRRYGRLVGHDWQEIKKECWGDHWWNHYDDPQPVPCGPNCRCCCGTGVFDIRWVRLERWEWLGYVFHRPVGDTRTPPDIGTVTIFGRIEHVDHGLLAREAALWLFLLCGEFRLLWREMRGCRMGRPRWWPLLRIQSVVFELSLHLGWRRCWCGRWFPHWGHGWCYCRQCRKAQDKAWRELEEIPF